MHLISCLKQEYVLQLINEKAIMINTPLVSREDSKIQQLFLMWNNIHYVLVVT